MPTDDSASDSDTDTDTDTAAEGPIVESSTIEGARVVIHAHPWQTPVDVITDTLDVQILATCCTLNGVEFNTPERALRLEDVRVTHDPRKGTLDIIA